MSEVGIDVDGDKKPDFQLDFKTLILVGGMIFSVASSYMMLQSEIENLKKAKKGSRI